MGNRQIYRWIWTGMSVIAGTIIGLNLEAFFAAEGMDRLLTGAWKAAPGWMATMIKIITSQTSLIIAIGVVTYTLGLWTERGFKHIGRMFNRPVDLPKLTKTCDRLARTAELIAPLIDFDNRHDLRFSLDLFKASYRLEQLGILNWDLLRHGNSAECLLSAKLLRALTPLLKVGDVDGARLMTEQIRSEHRALQSPSGTAT